MKQLQPIRYTKQTTPAQRDRSKARQIWTGIKLKIYVSVSVIVLLTVAAPNCSNASKAAVSDTTTVTLSLAEADSLINLIDDLDLENAVLRIDLREARALAANDSLLLSRRLTLQAQMYDDIIEIYKKDQDNWITRSLKHPAIWFCIGIYAGLNAR